jgi:hypothetical protein
MVHIRRELITDVPYDEASMKPLPAPEVPGNTNAERMDNAVRKMFTVSKREVLRREADWSSAHPKRKRANKLA